MKKIIALILAMIMSLSFCTIISAANTEYVYSYNGVDVMFFENSVFTEDMKQCVAYELVNGDDGATTYNLLCTLFGHKEEIECVTTISHKLSPVNPRCLSQTWEVHCCSRCNEALEMILLGEAYITCCPEE